MLSAQNSWTQILIAAVVAVTLAAAGLALTAFSPGVSPLVTSGLLLASLASTTVAFTSLALRLRRLELENEGLIEELSQEFDRVKDKLEIFGEALREPRTLSPEEIENTPMRRVMIK
jgi:hypothetical protein